MNADRAGLSPAVAAALVAPPDAERSSIAANGIQYAIRAWGDATAPPLLLIHGITASSAVWWRIGPALATGLRRRVIAVDQAGHGETVEWLGHPRHEDNASDLAAFVVAAGLKRPDLRVVGHSWGAMTAAWFPSKEVTTEVLVLLDPPVLPVAYMASMLDDPIERHYDDVDEAIRVLGSGNAEWGYGDVVAKAEGLTQFDERAVRDVLLGNGDWDGGLAAIDDPAARHVTIRLIRGEPAFGSLVPDPAAAAFGDRLGARNVITMAAGSHSPMRGQPEATTRVLLDALEPDLP